MAGKEFIAAIPLFWRTFSNRSFQDIFTPALTLFRIQIKLP
jgi:hypothetical protein